jgi:hypothetical protein
LHACLPGLRQIEVSLDQHTVIVLPYGPFRHVQPVERPALRVDRRFGRVQVLGHLAFVERPASERDDRARVADNRDHESVPEPIDEAPAVALDHQPALDLPRQRDLLVGESAPQRLPSGRRRVAVPEGLDRLGRQPSRLEFATGPGPGRADQLFPVEAGRVLVQLDERLALSRRRPFLRSAFGLRQLDAGPRRQVTDGFRKRHLLLPFDERHHVAADTAPEALEEPLVAVHVE